MNHSIPWKILPVALACFCLMQETARSGSESILHVSPTGDDQGAGTKEAPFRTLHRAQAALRSLLQDMQGNIVILLEPGDYLLEQPLVFTDADSGRNGHRVIWRSGGGPGRARLLGSVPLKGWQPERDGIWKIGLPSKLVFHTLYENGIRARKARFPDFERDQERPVALGRYLVTVDGNPKQNDKGVPRTRGPGWLTFPAEDLPPVTEVTKMRLHIFPGGKCDWVREVRAVTSIDREARRIAFDIDPVHGVGAGARFFLEDEKGFLNAPGEFFVDEKAGCLFYCPMGKGHPDRLGIAYPRLSRLIQFQGTSRDRCAERIVLDGLALEESDNAPPLPLWAFDGRRDGALVWMSNTSEVELRNCHLRNSGRSGILMIGHNTANVVAGCWIEHMGLNGVSMCNRFSAPGGKEPTADRCERNRVYNTRISYVGELHTYAECVTAFNVSDNEVDHCELSHSVRYAITVRGNTGAQYGPPVTTPHPPARGNRFHHIRVSHCGQDGGDMGALHCAGLNNPGGGSVNFFEQITVADTAAISSVQDIAPDGIFLDWPKMAMDQVFRDVEIIRSQGGAFRSHGPDNGASTQAENVSWKPGFREERMDYAAIGLTEEFPAAFGGRPVSPGASPPPAQVRVRAKSHKEVLLEWDAVPGSGQSLYRITRDGQEVARVTEPRWVDRHVKESTLYRYAVAARHGDFTHFGEAASGDATTPPDEEPPRVTAVRLSRGAPRARVIFSEPVDPAAATLVSNYRVEPVRGIESVRQVRPEVVELCFAGSAAPSSNPVFFSVQGITDLALARNVLVCGKPFPGEPSEWIVRYEPVSGAVPGSDRLEDEAGGGADALLRGGASLEAGCGPHGGAALVLDGVTAFAEAPPQLNLGPGDFTFALWVYRENSGVILSKGTDFGQPEQWSFGVAKQGVPGSVSLRINNQFFATGEQSVKLHRWIHLAFARSGKAGYSYVNGQPSGGPHDLSQIPPLVNDRPLRLGRREYETNPFYFKGRLAGLTIWPRALSPEEIHREAVSPRRE